VKVKFPSPQPLANGLVNRPAQLPNQSPRRRWRGEAKRILAERTLGQHQPKTIKFEDAYELFKQHHCARMKQRTSDDYQYTLSRRRSITAAARREAMKNNRAI
jgi:hypothetical protein